MCGIAGIFNYRNPAQPIDRDLLVRMTRVLWHRGPDDEGFHIDGPIGLGHRRLAIVDPTATGHQPMTTPDRLSWISYNGEFYNHVEFRQRLSGKGVTFKGTSDTETLLNLIALEGPGALVDVAGIFGLAFWDARRRRLILARDPLGVKQVYYHDDGNRLVFGSEIKAVLECETVRRELDPRGLNEYLHFHTTLFERTFFANIKQVRQGEYIEVNEHGARPKVYWQLDGFSKRRESPADHVEELHGMLRRVVGEQLMSDVPVGAFFSGGIDSSAVASFAKLNHQRLHCFGVHFTNQGVIDERLFQEQTAAALGLDLELTTLDGTEFPEDMSRLMYFQDEPVIGAAMLPMFAVSRLAARRVKVCLGGQAADEIFGGYARYSLARPFRVLSSWFAGRGKGRSDGSVPARVEANVGGNLLKQLLDPTNLRRLAGLATSGSWSSRYFQNFAKVPERSWRDVFAREVVSRRDARATFEDALARSPAKDPGDKVMHWDMQTYLTGLFHQDDRMSMANSLESRVPFADPRLVRFAFHTPFEMKIRAGATKWILRQALADVIPQDVLNRRKVGFDTPAESWIRAQHRDFVRDVLLSSASRTRGYWSAAAIERLLDREHEPMWFDRVWKLLSIEIWARVFLDGNVPAGIRSREADVAA